MKGGGGGGVKLTPPEKTTIKKPSLISVKSVFSSRSENTGH